jgi:hypothetical protein
MINIRGTTHAVLYGVPNQNRNLGRIDNRSFSTNLVVSFIHRSVNFIPNCMFVN